MTEKIELSEGTIDDPIGLAVFSASATEAPLRPELKFATEPSIGLCCKFSCGLRFSGRFNAEGIA